MGHGRAIINIENQDDQANIYQKIVSQNLSVRETETLVKNYQEGFKPKAGLPQTKTVSDVTEVYKKTFTTFFGAKIEVKMSSNGKGKIAIPFQSEEDLERILKLIKN
jgi:ParB family chromosome partitioning protein